LPYTFLIDVAIEGEFLAHGLDPGVSDGYLDDGFQKNGIFWYTGEGRKGDMRMTKGNLAIQNTAVNGKQLHLFEQTRKGLVQYSGEFSYLDHHEERAPDLAGGVRNVIVFESEVVSVNIDFAPVLPTPPVRSERAKFWTLALNQLRDLACAKSSKEQTPAERKRMVYERSEAVRIYVLRRAKGKCEGCEQKAPFNNNKGQPYLEPHHIARRADDGPDHPEWVAALCPNCHPRVHFGVDRKSYNELVAENIRLIERSHRSF
jgi:5-methylcytosine-specific restriction enzyme A